MNKIIRNIFFSLAFGAATIAYGAIPSVDVTVSDAGGKLAFKGATKSNGGFATEKLQPGKYVVQFNSKNAALKSGQYSIVVSAGKKKVVANAVSGQKFLSGGVAMKVDVGEGLKITGQIATGPVTTAPAQTNDPRKPQDQGEHVRKSVNQMPDKMPVPTGY